MKRTTTFSSILPILALIAMLNQCCLCRPAEEGDAAATGDNAKENVAATEGDKQQQPAADAKMQSPPQFVGDKEYFVISIFGRI
jgi:hypothetical protein